MKVECGTVILPKMRRPNFTPSLVLTGFVIGTAACSGPNFQMTYDRYDAQSNTYVNDTAGFALTMDKELRVLTDVQSTSARLFDLLPMPSGHELSMKAIGQEMGILIETTRMSPKTPLEDLQPLVFRAYEPAFRDLRYQQVSLEKREAHGIDYMEWVYRLRSPDFDRTFVEGMFLRGGYAVRVRALTNSDAYERSKHRIKRVLASLTAVEAVTSRQ